MNFKDDKFMTGLALCVVAFVIAQALFFLIRAARRAKELGIESTTVKNTIISSALFTIAPAVGIVATVLTLSSALGYVIPWIRLSVIGNISYEVTAATNAIDAYGIAGGISQEITDKTVFGTIAWVMTLGSIMPIILTPIFLKKIQGKVGKAVSGNKAWADVMSAAAFIGLIAAFVARAIAGKGAQEIIGDGAGVLSLAALISSIILMLLLSKLATLPKMKWLESFAMPAAMIGAMLIVVVLAQVLPHDIAFMEWRG